MGQLLQDLRFAVRMLRRSPGSAAVAVLSLALGIGANTVVYSLIDGLVFHPFAYPEVDRVLMLGVVYPRLSPDRCFFECLSPPELEEVRTASRTLGATAVFDLGNSSLSGRDVPERLSTAYLWGDPFATFGMQPQIGRGFLPAETVRESRVAIVSHRLWTTRFGADPNLVGRAIQVNGKPVTVVGVLPPGLVLVGTDLWLPMGAPPASFRREERRFNLIGRLAPGATLAAARTELAGIAGRIEREHHGVKEYAGWRLEPAPIVEVLAGQARGAAVLVLGAVGAVLLIACANVASLLLARAAARQREIAVRRALGAGRARLARQLLTESLLLAALGGGLGLALAAATIGPVTSLLPADFFDAGLSVSLDGRVLAFTLAIATLAGILFGLAPAAQAAAGQVTGRLEGEPGLPASGATTVSARGRRLRQALLVGEIAFALVLLAGAGLLLRSFARLQRVEPGFEPARVLTMRVTLPRDRYEGEAIAGFFDEVVRRVRALPGVRTAGAASQFPPANFYGDQVQIEGVEALIAGKLPAADVTVAGAGYLEALGIDRRAGRGLADSDVSGSPPVALVNEAAARRLFPDGKVLGRRLRLGGPGSDSPWTEVVGIVADVRNHGLAQPTAPEVFVPARQVPDWWNQLYVLIRTEGDPLAVLPEVRKTVAAIDPDQPVYAIQTLEGVFSDSVIDRRGAMVLLATFAGLAVLLAAVGIYGVMAYMVAERRREIGIRMALGAERHRVLGLIASQALQVVALGIALGLAGALALGQILEQALADLLFGLSGHDPATLAAGAALLAVVALLASYLPARRASRLSPLVALRQD